VQIEAYRQEAALLGVRNFPPLNRTVQAVMASADIFFGAFSGGELLGVISLERRSENQVSISSLTVAPPFQRRGVGKALVSSMGAWTKGHKVSVSTGAKNAPALALYKQFGFVESSRSLMGTEQTEVVELAVERSNLCWSGRADRMSVPRRGSSAARRVMQIRAPNCLAGLRMQNSAQQKSGLAKLDGSLICRPSEWAICWRPAAYANYSTKMHMALAVPSRPKFARFLLLAGITSSLLISALSRADDPKTAPVKAPEPPPPPKWESDGTIGLTLTRGNSKTFMASAALNSKRKWANNEILLGATGGYGESTTKNSGLETTSTTDNYVRGFGQYNYLFTERLYGGLRLYGEHDEIAALTYRFTLSPLAGYYFIKTTNAFLSGEVGPSLVTEKQGGIEKTYFGARIAERGEYKFSTGAKVWESIEWVPQVDNVDNWVATLEAGVSAPLTKSLEVKLVLQDVYDNEPAAGRLKNDLKLIAGVGFKF
jgi:GNAT superfamily N-acetyltransferase